ncbi:MAG: biotin carboxylase N-terminal domain-containing protein, partial [Nocardioides sp.]
MIQTLLIANRGEIAVRVMRTARAMGIRTVALFTDLDHAAPHVKAADDAVRVGSYLDIDAVVAAARAVGADAVHPGYGFLSERAVFAAALEAAGIKLVGPSAAVMEQMGRKDAAREIAVAAGVPVVPTGTDAHFPVLVKAAAGGGGKGMRIVRSAEEYDEAVAAAKREALSAFGDDTILVEKYVEHGRHIEVQVLADAHGNVVHLFERDCSTQRRHQKVLEEA